MIMLVIAAALTLPTLLFVGLNELRSLQPASPTNPKISLFLETHPSSETLQHLLDDFKKDPQIADVRYISPEVGLREFEQQTGLHDVINELTENPLPPVVEITLDSIFMRHKP